MELRNRGYCGIGLHCPEHAVNIGGILRAAGIFGAAFILKNGQPYHHHCADTMKAFRRLPLFEVEDVMAHIPYGCIPVGVEIVPGAKSLESYCHPQQAFYIFGPEGGSLPGSILSQCREVVSIPSDGCLNLAAAVNVFLYDRVAKQHRQFHQEGMFINEYQEQRLG